MSPKNRVTSALGAMVVLSLVLAACGQATPVAVVQTVVVPGEVQIVTATPSPAQNPYIGSNALDGNGIPTDFFNDVHIRKAFSYCFDWGTFVNDVYKGEAIQAFTLTLPGMPGFDLNAPHYTFDLAKCAEEFKLADVDKDGIAAGDETDGSDVWNVGFRMQMLYNQGNTTRQIVAEILQANLAQVNEKFVVETLGLPWPAYLAAQRAFKIPIMTAGWQEDIHDPHNWYQPYTTGAYGSRQGMPEDMRAQFKALLDAGVGETDPAKRNTIYQEFNQLYYDLVPGVPLVYATSHGFEQKWLEGRIFNPIFSGDIYASMTKVAGAKNPDTITQATIGDADTLDPALAYDTASGEIIQNVYETLVFYDGVATNKFVPSLAESWTTSDDGKVWTFQMRSGVKFHEGQDLTASDVSFSLVRGLLQGGTASPQWLLTEPFFGVGIDDVSLLVDPEGNLYDDREALSAADPAKLVAACEQAKAAIVADDAAGTVTMTLAQPWGPFLATIAQSWGSIMNQGWVAENGGWDGSCDTWQNFYGMVSADDPFTTIANGTGAYKLDHWTQGTEIVLTRNDAYWGTPAKLGRVAILIIPEWGTRFAMLQAGDADFVDVPVENRSQADALVGERCEFDLTANVYKPCEVVDASKPLRLHIGRPGIAMDVIIYNFGLK
jgi:ABC-type transport system substrate-binding protein